MACELTGSHHRGHRATMGGSSASALLIERQANAVQGGRNDAQGDEYRQQCRASADGQWGDEYRQFHVRLQDQFTSYADTRSWKPFWETYPEAQDMELDFLKGVVERAEKMLKTIIILLRDVPNQTAI